jgi:hypothetical protein
MTADQSSNGNPLIPADAPAGMEIIQKIKTVTDLFFRKYL